MKRLFIFLLSFLCSYSYAMVDGPFNKIVFFGDSLTDNGNLYRLFLKVVPKSPPYYQGRFSNGPLWSENIAKYYYDKYYASSTNYAYGGATTIFHKPTSRFVTLATLGIEVNNYYLNCRGCLKDKTLFTLWMGPNDYLYDMTSKPEDLTREVVNKMSTVLSTLMEQGGQYFLVMNMPDLARAPYSKSHNVVERMHKLTVLHNEKLAEAIEVLRLTHQFVKIVYIDTYSIFNDVVANTEKYNKEFNINIKNTSDSCWKGGMVFDDPTFDPLVKGSSYLKNSHINIGMQKNYSLPEIIKKSPTLYQTYQLGENFDKGYKPCDNANEYLFWDSMHPTQVVHDILSRIVIRELDKQIIAPSKNQA